METRGQAAAAPSAIVPAARSSRYGTLDGMRGAAAVMVVLYHLGQSYHSAHLSGGYLAVDLFFVLSGFVIGSRYETRLVEGLSFRRFMEARCIRLYPSYIVGLVLATALASFYAGIDAVGALAPLQIVANFLPNLFFLPGPTGPNLYRLNLPVWSLLFELIANGLFAIVGYRLATKHLAWIAGCAVASLVALSLQSHSTDLGFQQGTTSFCGGLARVLWSFTVGIVLARLPHPDRRRAWLAIGLIAILVAYFLLPTFGSWHSARDLIFVIVISPALAFARTRVEPPALLRRGFALLGDVSYPLYATHFPILNLMLFVGMEQGLPHKLITPVFVGAALMIAWLITYTIDAPARDRLSRLLGLFRSSPPRV